VTSLKPAIPTIASVLGISQSTARRLVRKGLIPTVRVGGRIRIDECDLQTWIEKGGAGGWKRALQKEPIRRV
jgi:excisionase family DNA binding protein